jgi:hypothetical protein
LGPIIFLLTVCLGLFNMRADVRPPPSTPQLSTAIDRLCGLVVRVPGYRSRGSGLDSRRYQIFWEAVGLERGPLSLVRIIRSYLNGKVAAPGLENRDYGHGDPLRWPRDTLCQLKLALTSPAGFGRSVGIVRLRTNTTELFLFPFILSCWSKNDNAYIQKAETIGMCSVYGESERQFWHLVWGSRLML